MATGEVLKNIERPRRQLTPAARFSGEATFFGNPRQKARIPARFSGQNASRQREGYRRGRRGARRNDDTRRAARARVIEVEPRIYAHFPRLRFGACVVAAASPRPSAA